MSTTGSTTSVTVARRTKTTWEGAPDSGQGTITSDSHALDGLRVTWPSRLHDLHGNTSPEELASAAHSACFAMTFEKQLGKHQLVSQQLDVTATITLDETNDPPTIVSSAIQLRARVHGLDNASFQAIVNETTKACPISRLFTGATITVDAAPE